MTMSKSTPNTAAERQDGAVVAVAKIAAALERLAATAERVEQRLIPGIEPDWRQAVAFRWRRHHLGGALQPVLHRHRIELAQLVAIEPQKAIIEQNTRQFVAGRPANNVLLTGARGTGKSSLVKALLHSYSDSGLRLIEVDKSDLVDLPDIVDRLYTRPERFIIFCDDLSFDAGEAGFKALKVALDGSVAAPSENVLVYATSNRRHLMPESMQDNRDTMHRDGEIHPAEAVEEKISLSERFGIWLSFYPFSQDEYLTAVRASLLAQGVASDDDGGMDAAALRWALGRGSRSGRVAAQFARDWAGRRAV